MTVAVIKDNRKIVMMMTVIDNDNDTDRDDIDKINMDADKCSF